MKPGVEDSTTRDPKTHAIIGAAMEVHRELGAGFLEAVYAEAFEIELQQRPIPYRREVTLQLSYKGSRLKSYYRADFVCYENIVVELKALGVLSGNDEAQLINCLKATASPLGLLLNFGASSLEYKRMVLTGHRKD